MEKFTTMNENGFIMVWSLLLLIVVTLLGAAGISTSIFERRMAANEALHKQAFYEADGGTENALALLVENINCISGFQSTDLAGDILIEGSLNFWINNNVSGEIPMASDSDRDFYYPRSTYDPDDNPGEPHTNGRINGTTKLMTGANLPMLAGYLGKAKAMGSDGAFLEFDLKVEHRGTRNSRTGIHTKFRLDNQFASYPAGGCVY